MLLHYWHPSGLLSQARVTPLQQNRTGITYEHIGSIVLQRTTRLQFLPPVYKCGDTAILICLRQGSEPHQCTQRLADCQYHHHQWRGGKLPSEKLLVQLFDHHCIPLILALLLLLSKSDQRGLEAAG